MGPETEEIKYDEVTGMPELPNGWVWTVEHTRDAWHEVDYITVSIKFPATFYKFEFFGLRLGKYTKFVRYREFSSLFYDPADLMKETEKVYRDYRKSVAKEKAINNIVGIYPPKKIVS